MIVIVEDYVVRTRVRVSDTGMYPSVRHTKPNQPALIPITWGRLYEPR